jgi:mRNA-degrading endonuclease toxin of MazEF toxin-antitoxin module
MAIPTPVVGLVIRYSYLWHREFLAGGRRRSKDRPCAIVAALRFDEDGETRVLVLPITHGPPNDTSACVEIPAKVKGQLGLDAARSWVVINDGMNLFGLVPTYGGFPARARLRWPMECRRRGYSRRSARDS